jgi:hypothetical protein
MRKTIAISVALSFSLLLPLACGGAERVSGKQVELHWSELGPFIAARQIKAVLTNGTYIKGRAIAVNPDALVLDKKGRTSIPRESVSTISVTETKGVAGRITLTLVGTLACGAGAGYIGVQAAGSGGLGAALAGVTAACGVGGYYAGRAIDRRTTLIKILPD